jgi:isoquinoline 1-oxidoreductase alpha subunit
VGLAGRTGITDQIWLRRRDVAACTVHVGGEAVILPPPAADVRRYHHDRWIGRARGDACRAEGPANNQVAQCGYCQSGQIMPAAALLRVNPNPCDDDIDQAMSAICAAVALTADPRRDRDRGARVRGRAT